MFSWHFSLTLSEIWLLEFIAQVYFAYKLFVLWNLLYKYSLNLPHFFPFKWIIECIIRKRLGIYFLSFLVQTANQTPLFADIKLHSVNLALPTMSSTDVPPESSFRRECTIAIRALIINFLFLLRSSAFFNYLLRVAVANRPLLIK